MITSAPTGRSEEVRQAERTLERIGLHIRAADEKIRALFGANTLLAAALTFTSQVRLRALPSPWGELAVTGTILMLLATVCSILLAMVALLPRTKRTGQPGITFFGDIASMGQAEFQERFLASENEDPLPGLLHQVHISARIAHAKHRYMRQAGQLLILALGLWFVLLVWNLMIPQ
ncbi:MAG: hypothetical protein IPM12_15460 [Flavobacteriales bacterium]|nr:hypothetical protein [Flavobacteriales bacterium]